MRGGAIFVSLAMAASLAAAQSPLRPAIPATPAPASGPLHDVSVAEYRQHLQALTAVVDDCAKTRNTKACNPAQVGGDDNVALGSAANAWRRVVRYDWLRVLLERAGRTSSAQDQKKAAATAKAAAKNPDVLPPPPTTEELLKAAKVRLAADIAQAGGALKSDPGHAAQRAAMKQVLAGREFLELTQTTPAEKLREKFDNWLNSLIHVVIRAGARASWLGRAVEWGAILAICGALIWVLVQLERRWRIRLTPESFIPATGAASARDWQLWLEDARKAAAARQWREAIHFAYWAAISRLESRRLWPADRARTPREYLALLRKDDPRHAGLAALTGSFERTWYGGRTAVESDYARAQELADALIAANTVSISGRGGGTR